MKKMTLNNLKVQSFVTNFDSNGSGNVIGGLLIIADTGNLKNCGDNETHAMITDRLCDLTGNGCTY